MLTACGKLRKSGEGEGVNQAIQNLTDSGRIEKGMWWEKAWRLVEGCTKISPGCTHCWSERQAHLRSGNPKMQAQYGGVTNSDGKWNNHIKYLKMNLNIPFRRKKPTVFAVWNDLFNEKLFDDGISVALKAMWECPQHIFIVLTKRPERALDYFSSEEKSPGSKYLMQPIPPNLWLGVSVENQEQADKRIPILKEILSAISFVSLEPLLENIFMSKHLGITEGQWLSMVECEIKPNKIDWIICGNESLGGKPGRWAPGCIDHIRYIKNSCVKNNVPFFLKQMVSNDGKQLIKMPELDGRIWSQFPEAK